MDLYSLDNDRLEDIKENSINKDIEYNNKYTLSKPSIINNLDDNITYGIYKVAREESMRIDLICNKLYGTLDYVEHLMKVNNILNPFTIKEGDIIFYLPISILTQMEVKEDNIEVKKISLELVDKQKENISPSSKPKQVKQTTRNGNDIKLLNQFKRNA